MKLIKESLLTMFFLIISLPLWAHCRPATLAIPSPPISIILSDTLNSVSTSVTETKTTLFTGNYICTAPGVLGLGLLGKNSIAIVNIFSQGSTTIGFNGGAQLVEVNVTKITNSGIADITATAYPANFPAANLNTQFTMTFTLVSTKQLPKYIEVTGNTITIDAVVVATDASGLTLVDALLSLVNKLIEFLSTLKWPVDRNDIFIQPVTLTYNPPITTCDFANRDLSVKLPMVTINTLKTATRPGFTPFSLNFQCSNLINGTNTSRDISVFLSSSNLLATDKTVLKNTQTQGAKNVGFRLVKAASLDNPVILSDSVNLKDNATDIFKVLKAAPLAASFTVNMGVYYYPYVVNDVTGGAVSSSARLVFSYD